MAIADLPYVHAAGDGGLRARTQMVVIHATDNTASDEAESAYAAHRADKTSAHLYVDGDSAVLCLPLGDVAYGCYPTGNSRSVQVELCGRSNQITDQTLREAAPLVAEVCARYGIPIRKIGPADLVAGARGICGHADVTAAWHEGDHTDPGSAYPWSTFISYVQAAAGGNDVGTLDGIQAVQLRNAEAMLAGLRDDVPVIAGLNDGSKDVTVPNALAAHLKRISDAQAATDAKVTALAARPAGSVTLSATDRAAIVADLKTAIATAAQIAQELANRLGNG